MGIDYCNCLSSAISASDQLVLLTSQSFVHTAGRYYRLSDSVNNLEIELFCFAENVFRSSVKVITWRKEKSGEPGEGSLTHSSFMFVHVALWPCG